MTDKTPFYITTAISYPNGKPHIGHAYELIATDAMVGSVTDTKAVSARELCLSRAMTRCCVPWAMTRRRSTR